MTAQVFEKLLESQRNVNSALMGVYSLRRLMESCTPIQVHDYIHKVYPVPDSALLYGIPIAEHPIFRRGSAVGGNDLYAMLRDQRPEDRALMMHMVERYKGKQFAETTSKWLDLGVALAPVIGGVGATLFGLATSTPYTAGMAQVELDKCRKAVEKSEEERSKFMAAIQDIFDISPGQKITIPQEEAAIKILTCAKGFIPDGGSAKEACQQLKDYQQLLGTHIKPPELLLELSNYIYRVLGNGYVDKVMKQVQNTTEITERKRLIDKETTKMMDLMALYIFAASTLGDEKDPSREEKKAAELIQKRLDPQTWKLFKDHVHTAAQEMKVNDPAYNSNLATMVWEIAGQMTEAGVQAFHKKQADIQDALSKRKSATDEAAAKFKDWQQKEQQKLQKQRVELTRVRRENNAKLQAAELQLTAAKEQTATIERQQKELREKFGEADHWRGQYQNLKTEGIQRLGNLQNQLEQTSQTLKNCAETNSRLRNERNEYKRQLEKAETKTRRDNRQLQQFAQTQKQLGQAQQQLQQAQANTRQVNQQLQQAQASETQQAQQISRLQDRLAREITREKECEKLAGVLGEHVDRAKELNLSILNSTKRKVSEAYESTEQAEAQLTKLLRDKWPGAVCTPAGVAWATNFLDALQNWGGRLDDDKLQADLYERLGYTTAFIQVFIFDNLRFVTYDVVTDFIEATADISVSLREQIEDWNREGLDLQSQLPYLQQLYPLAEQQYKQSNDDEVKQQLKNYWLKPVAEGKLSRKQQLDNGSAILQRLAQNINTATSLVQPIEQLETRTRDNLLQLRSLVLQQQNLGGAVGALNDLRDKWKDALDNYLTPLATSTGTLDFEQLNEAYKGLGGLYLIQDGLPGMIVPGETVSVATYQPVRRVTPVKQKEVPKPWQQMWQQLQEQPGMDVGWGQ
uniref:Uncharacterized protein n=1 Tax=viral metagenome TaxID=1070528 RepID=A0A6C0BP82_9ZZZZ